MRFAPASLNQDLFIDIFDFTNYFTPHLQVGNPVAIKDPKITTWRSVTIPRGSFVEAGNFNASNQSFDIYAGSASIDGQIGANSPLKLSFGVHATGLFVKLPEDAAAALSR